MIFILLLRQDGLVLKHNYRVWVVSIWNYELVLLPGWHMTQKSTWHTPRMHEWEEPPWLSWLTWMIGGATPFHMMNGRSYHGTSHRHSAGIGSSTDASFGLASHSSKQLTSQMNSSKSLSVSLY